MATRITAAECRAKAQECRDMQAERPDHRVILQHIAETWERLATELEGVNGKGERA